MPAMTFIGVPIDSVGRDGGAEHGPAALRELGLPAALGGADGGDLEVRIRGEQRDGDGILAGPDVLSATATIRAAVAARIAAGERPFLAGGCCAELPGALAGARDALGATVGLVHFDGHLDLYDGVTSPTGEAADMPVSVALGLGPANWVAACGGASADPGRTALVGFRDRAESLEYGMRQPEQVEPPPRTLSLEDLRAGDPGEATAELAAELGAQGRFWLHFDVDVLAPEVFPATDYLMPGGINWAEARAVLAPLLASPALIGASLGCYNPEKDPGHACGKALVEALAA